MNGSSGQEDRRRRDDQGGRRIGEDRDQYRDQECQSAGEFWKGVEGFFLVGISTVCGRLAPNQLVHARAGNPVPFSKVPGQVLQVGNFIEQGMLGQGDLEDWLSTDRGARLGAHSPI